MSYLATFTNDVYVSYAHPDDELFAHGHHGWVEAFHRALATRVSQMLGEPVNVCQSNWLRGNDILSAEIERAVSESAVFVCVVSPSYVEIEYCRAS